MPSDHLSTQQLFPCTSRLTETLTLPRPWPDLGTINEPIVSSKQTATTEAPRLYFSCQPLLDGLLPSGLPSSEPSSSTSSLPLPEVPFMLAKAPCLQLQVANKRHLRLGEQWPCISWWRPAPIELNPVAILAQSHAACIIAIT